MRLCLNFCAESINANKQSERSTELYYYHHQIWVCIHEKKFLPGPHTTLQCQLKERQHFNNFKAMYNSLYTLKF